MVTAATSPAPFNDVQHRTPSKSIPSLGGEGILIEADLIDLNEGTKRVARLMADGQKHSRAEIDAAAGQEEGTRRLRELREVRGVVIHRERVAGTRQFYYWLARQSG